MAVEASTTFNTSRTQADIEYRVDPGPRVKLGDIFISGNLRTAEQVIRRELEVQPARHFHCGLCTTASVTSGIWHFS